MTNIISRLAGKFLAAKEADLDAKEADLDAKEVELERRRGDASALAGMVQDRTRLLMRQIEGARGSVKPEVLADLAAYDQTLAPDWRGVATDAALLASLAEIDRAMRAEMEADLTPSDDEAVRRRQRDVQQIAALVEGHAQPDPTHPIEDWHREAADLIDDALVEAARDRRVVERAGAEAGTSTPPTADKTRRMVHRNTAVMQVANLVEGRPNPLGPPGPGRRHRTIAAAIRDTFDRHGGAVKTPLFPPDETRDKPGAAPGESPHSRRDPKAEGAASPARTDHPRRDPDLRKIPGLVRAHISARPMDSDERDALVRAVKTALVFGRPYMKRRAVEAVGARCASRSLSPDRIKRAQEVAGLVTAGFNTRSLVETAASLDARGATPYQIAVGLTSDVIVTMAKRNGARVGPEFPKEMERTVADLADDPAYYLDLYALAADVDRTEAPLGLPLPPDEGGWRADAASIIRDAVYNGGR